jgi:hypothetical protein
MTAGNKSSVDQKIGNIGVTKHGMHLCSPENDFPNTKLADMEQGFQNTYCVDDWRSLKL